MEAVARQKVAMQKQAAIAWAQIGLSRRSNSRQRSSDKLKGQEEERQREEEEERTKG